MRQEGIFWRSVGIIGVAHVVFLAGLMKWSGRTKEPTPIDILWMDGGALALTDQQGTADAQVSTAIPSPAEPPLAPPPESAAEEPPELTSEATPAQSDVPLPTPAFNPTATPKPTASPVAKPTPKSTPKPTPKKSPAKASPTASPKPKPVAKKTPAPEAKKISVKPDVTPAAVPDENKPAADKGANADAAGAGGTGTGPGGASQFGAYASMLHDRFFSEWVQPTTIVATGAKMSALVRIRIEKDGRVSSFEIVKPSGNVIVDESVAAVSKRVTKVDPLPPGLARAGYYDVKINFELNSEQ